MISLLLKDIAEKKNLHIRDNASLKNLIDLMNKNQKGVVVVLKDKKPVGILTERDIIEILFNGVDLNERDINYAKKNLITTSADRTVGYALNLMLDNNIRRIIVVDSSDNFLGVVTHQDMLKHLEEDFYRTTIKVRQILDRLRPLIGASPDSPLSEVLKKMIKNKISAIPVIKDRRTIGIITERDIIGLASKGVSLDKKVNNYMSKPVITANSDITLINAVKIMSKHNIRRIVINGTEGASIGILTIRDVLKVLEGNYTEFLERKFHHARDVLNLFPAVIMEVADTDKEHLITWSNEKAIDLFSMKIIDKPVTKIIPAKTWGKIYPVLLKSHKIENMRFKKRDNIYELTGFFIKTDDVLEKGRIQLIIKDITEDIKLSIIDSLTCLYNRRFINEVLMKETERSSRLNKKFSLVMFDLDDFKKVNDLYGHFVGDNVLKSIAKLTDKGIRKADIAGRYGGEEFVIIMPETDKKTAYRVTERLRTKIGNKEIMTSKKKKITITASFGIASYPEDGTSPEDLLLMSDERLYRAKKEGKNRTVL